MTDSAPKTSPIPAAKPLTHKHETFDRALRAAMARMTSGLSPYAAVAAWNDWLVHLAAAPGRQVEMVEHAQRNAAKLAAFWAGQMNGETKPPFHPKPEDHRFTDPNWAKPPYDLMQQGFLATQDWWDHATCCVPGALPHTSFQIFRQPDRRILAKAGDALRVYPPAERIALFIHLA